MLLLDPLYYSFFQTDVSALYWQFNVMNGRSQIDGNVPEMLLGFGSFIPVPTHDPMQRTFMYHQVIALELINHFLLLILLIFIFEM